MSLIRIAARIAAVEALKGQTLVGDNVLDSQIGAIDVSADGVLRSDQEKQFIAVYADAASTKVAGNELRALLVNGATEFLFETGITATMTETDPETGASEIFAGIPGTDQAFEFYLDLVVRQIGDALTDPANEWAEIFRRMLNSVSLVERARTASDRGVRLAGQQVKMTVSLIADPIRGQELKAAHPLAAFFAKVAAGDNEVVKNQAALMRAQIDGVSEYAWQGDQRRYGMTAGEMRNLLLSMQEGAEADIALVEVNSSPAAPVGPTV